MNRKFDRDEFRNAWLESHVKHLLAAQFRALRGEAKQSEFGERIGVPQSVVARYENPAYGSMTIKTLLEIAKRLKIGLQVKFVPFSAVMDEAKNLSESDLAPPQYATDMKIRDSRGAVQQHNPPEAPLMAVNAVRRAPYRTSPRMRPATIGNEVFGDPLAQIAILSGGLIPDQTAQSHPK